PRPPQRIAEARRHDVEALKTQFATIPNTVPDAGLVETLIAGAIVERLRDPENGDSSARERYRSAIDLVCSCQRNLRRSQDLIQQDRADGCEIMLIEELRAPHARQRLGDEV